MSVLNKTSPRIVGFVKKNCSTFMHLSEIKESEEDYPGISFETKEILLEKLKKYLEYRRTSLDTLINADEMILTKQKKKQMIEYGRLYGTLVTIKSQVKDAEFYVAPVIEPDIQNNLEMLKKIIDITMISLEPRRKLGP